MLQQMPSGIQEKAEFSTIEPGKILFTNENVELVLSQKGKVMIKVALRGVQPAQVANMPHFHNFVIGSDEDPGADLPDTWVKNAGRFKSFCIACNVPFDGYPITQVVSNCIGKQVGAHVKTKIRQSKPGEDNRYDGQPEANVAKWLTPGNFQPELDSQVGAGAMPQGMPTQQQMEAPGQGTFAPPGGIQPANPSIPQDQAPQGVPPQQNYAPPATQQYTPPPPAGPPATPGMDSGQYVPQNQPYQQGGAQQPGQGQVYDPNQGQQQPYAPPGAPANPSLPPGVM